MWQLYSFLAAISAALVAIFGKLGVKNIDSTLATTIRSLIMTLFLLLVSFSFGKWRSFTWSSIQSRDWWLIVLAGVAGALSWLFYFYALKSGVASKVAAIDRLSIVFVVLLAGAFLSEGFSWKSIIGSLMMSVGAILISLK